MNNQKGYSLVELMVIVVIMATAGIVVVALVSGGGNDISIGINGLSETRCIGGYKFIVGEGGQSRQILNEQGGGIRCN